MRAALVVVVVLVVLGMLAGNGETVARKKRRDRPHIIRVLDYTSPAWEGVIAETVDDFNAVMPKRGPRIVHERRPPLPCEDVPPAKHAIRVCTDPTLSHPGTWYIRSRLMVLHETHPDFHHFAEEIACHEFMHAIAGIRDNYDSRGDSCVWGTMTEPGPFDVAALKRAFKKAKRHR